MYGVLENSSAVISRKLTVAKETLAPTCCPGMPSGQRCLSHGFGSTRAESRQLVSLKDHGQRSIGEHSSPW
jgi:hypothetical protein